MINELLEVREYLEGKNINKRCVYRICYLLAKYYHEQGLDNLEIRKKIFDWANANKLYLEFTLNGLIFSATQDKTKLRGDVKIYIGQADIDQIKLRFDSRNTRMLALAMLCYGKACANTAGECSVSMLGMANWINIDYSSTINRHLRELIDFKYVSKLVSNRKWKSSSRQSMTRVKYNVPLMNEGESLLVDNNVLDIFNKYF